MKHLHLFIILMSMVWCRAYAHDFEAPNNNGVTIYYNFTDGSTGSSVYVTYRGSSFSEYSNEYSGNVVIPEKATYNGKNYSVTSIGTNALYDCSGLTSVTIPTSVTEIDNYAFYGCNNISSVIWNAKECANFEIRDVTTASLGGLSFHHYEAGPFYASRGVINNFIIGDSVKSLPANLFYEMYNINVFWNSVACSDMSACPFGSIKQITIGENVKRIPAYLCKDQSGLVRVNIPNSVEVIGSYAFDGCTGLNSITIPKNIVTIGSCAFNNNGVTVLKWNAQKCSIVSNDSFSSKIESVTFGDGVKIIPENLCNGKGKIKSVSIPNTVDSIGKSAFSRCSGLTSVTIPTSVMSIGDYAFYHCEGLTSVNIPASVTSIGDGAFQYCSGLTSVNVPASVTSIGSGAFAGCSRLTSVSIPVSVTSIGDYAFQNCSGLTSVNIPASVTSIGDYTFRYCSSLTSVTIPISVTNIGGSAFMGCSSLTSVTIPISVTSIGGSAFANCSGLTSVTIPISVTNIGGSAFMGCSSLTSVTIPISVTNIGDYAFQNCRSLTSVTIPASVTSIGNYAFYGCSGLTAILVDKQNPCYCSIGGILFTYDKSRIVAYPGGKKGSYTIPTCVTSIGGYGEFCSCIGLTSVAIPASVTSIQSGTFDGCSKLQCLAILGKSSEVGGSITLPTSCCVVYKSDNPPYYIYRNKKNAVFSNVKAIFVPKDKVEEYSIIDTGNTYLPTSDYDVEIFDKATAAEYAKALGNIDRNEVKSVALYCGVDESFTEAMMKDGMNPNCLYYMYADSVMKGSNIVDWKSLTATSVVLQDDHAFCAPLTFSAAKAQLTHTPNKWADGTRGWETLCIPFDVAKYKASKDGYITPILLGSYGDFWLRQFSGASRNNIYFSSTLDGLMKANTPYVVAFPGNKMGAGSLEGQTISFIGRNVSIDAGAECSTQRNDYIFQGNYDKEADDAEGWKLNAEGSRLEYSSIVGDKPFRAYFRMEESDEAWAKPLSINFTDTEEADAVMSIEGEEATQMQEVYDASGRLLHRCSGSDTGLKRGFYIINKKKVIVK